MDLDIEMGDAEVHETYDGELPRGEDILQPDEPEEPGEIPDSTADGDDSDASRIVPTKIHIRGLDTLHTNDITAYVTSHSAAPDRIEWIDDSSANLVFSSAPSARDALAALSAIDIADASALASGESLPAKPMDGRPDISLHLRLAVQSDRKVAGAALRSRYYLLHPEYDPEERRRQSKYRERDHSHHNRHSHHRQPSRRGRRDDTPEEETFDASMYDDAPAPAPKSQNQGKELFANQGKELFADRLAKSSGKRTRSASPDRESTSSRNRTKARSIRDSINSNNSTGNQSKELFPSKSSHGGQLDQLEAAIGSAQLRDDDLPKIVPTGQLNIRGLAQRAPAAEGFAIKGAASAKELFPDKFGNSGKELISKRRQRAEDLFS